MGQLATNQPLEKTPPHTAYWDPASMPSFTSRKHLCQERVRSTREAGLLYLLASTYLTFGLCGTEYLGAGHLRGRLSSQCRSNVLSSRMFAAGIHCTYSDLGPSIRRKAVLLLASIYGEISVPKLVLGE